LQTIFLIEPLLRPQSRSAGHPQNSLEPGHSKKPKKESRPKKTSKRKPTTR